MNTKGHTYFTHSTETSGSYGNQKQVFIDIDQRHLSIVGSTDMIQYHSHDTLEMRVRLSFRYRLVVRYFQNVKY